eukprot:1255234-Pleurochrysis_carterae.AAC.1
MIRLRRPTARMSGGARRRSGQDERKCEEHPGACVRREGIRGRVDLQRSKASGIRSGGKARNSRTIVPKLLGPNGDGYPEGSDVQEDGEQRAGRSLARWACCTVSAERARCVGRCARSERLILCGRRREQWGTLDAGRAQIGERRR